MAKETKKSAGSNKAKCKKYSDRMHAERNKVRRLKRHLKSCISQDGVQRDSVAMDALKEALKKHSGE